MSVGTVESRKKYGFLKASFTIEAAVVLPIVMVAMVSVVFLTIYLYDCVSLTAVGSYAVLEQAGNEQSENLTDGCAALLNQRLLAASDVFVSVSGDDRNAAAEMSANFQLPLGMIRQLFSEEIQQMQKKISLSNLNGRKTLLLYKAICEGTVNLLQED